MSNSIITLILYAVSSMMAAVQGTDLTIVDFSSADGGDWVIVNDGVMGGISQSRMAVDENGVALFEGYLSLENNGGFASTRMTMPAKDLDAYHGIRIRVRGDGRTYQLRLRTDDNFDGISYRQFFETTRDKWQEIELPFSNFEPTFRGRILSNVPALQPAKIRQIGFMLSDKKQGDFELQIAWIKAFTRK